MVSKTRVVLIMLALIALMIAVIVLLAAVHADAFWFTVLPFGVLSAGAAVAQSLGWFTAKTRD